MKKLYNTVTEKWVPVSDEIMDYLEKGKPYKVIKPGKVVVNLYLSGDRLVSKKEVE